MNGDETTEQRPIGEAASAPGGLVQRDEHGTTVVYAGRFVAHDEKRRARPCEHSRQAVDQRETASHKTSFMVASRRASCHVGGMDIETVARRLAELGNSTRLRIVRLLVRAGGEGLAIGELQSRLGVPPSTLAFHLRGLVSAGLVAQERQGRVVRCRPEYAVIDATLAFVKEHCCAGFDDKQPRAPSAPATTGRRTTRAA